MLRKACDLKKGDRIMHPIDRWEEEVRGMVETEGWCIIITREVDPKSTARGFAFSCLRDTELEVLYEDKAR